MVVKLFVFFFKIASDREVSGHVFCASDIPVLSENVFENVTVTTYDFKPVIMIHNLVFLLSRYPMFN
jgi:hypothetical protein